jgi:aryl-alcohol dehydrogenase-like predicted oxidoreductase
VLQLCRLASSDAQWTARQAGIHAFVSCQDEYSLLVRDIERELLPAMQRFGLSLLPYFPLASGLLTGKYQRGREFPKDSRFGVWQRLAERYANESNWNVVQRLQEFCSSRDHTLLELAFSWLTAKPMVASVIAGATKPEQVEQNVKAADWRMSSEEVAEVDRITKKPGC